MEKVAVVLFNLGGPDSPAAVKPFLFNFFMDKNIIALPLPFRFLLAKLISNRRSKREAGESYGELGGASPLLANSQEQAKALEKELGAGFKVFVCMRYWHPMADQIVREVQDWGADRVVLLPLYPQFSTTTTWSSLGAWEKAAHEVGFETSTTNLCCYPLDEGFIKASAAQVMKAYKAALKDGHKAPRLLFSAHGLPEDIIKKGDPYQWQCEQSAAKIAEVMGVKDLDWQICYQSRVGPKKWIGPSLDEALEKAAQDKKAVVIYPHAFTQEHVETLVELDIEYKEMAEELGIEGYYRAGTVGAHPDFITGLAELVKKGQKTYLCPENFKRCCQRS